MTTSQPSPPPPQPKIRRVGPQLLSDEIIADELLADAQPKGGRLLTTDRDPWAHNAWDQVEWDEEQELLAQATVAKQATVPVPDDLQELYNGDPGAQWDGFYTQMKDRFFNDRAWLRTEFTELADVVKPGAGPKRVVEIGCGPGNTLYPLLAANENPELQLHGLDFSKEAIALVKKNPTFDPKCCHAQVWDLSSKAGLPSSIAEGSVDVAILIFCLSALHPDEWAQAVENIWRMLKPGGALLFRDYGRHDMAQLRFKGNRYLQPNLYIRGDHTRVYFFERDELVTLFGPATRSIATTTPSSPTLDSLSVSDSTSEVPPTEGPTTKPPTSTAPTIPSSTTRTLTTAVAGVDLTPPTPFRFELLNLGVDRRLLLNRKKQLKMYRIWLQGRWRKPLV